LEQRLDVPPLDLARHRQFLEFFSHIAASFSRHSIRLPTLKELSGQKPRQIAACVLRRRAAVTDYVETLLDEALAGARLSPADRRLCQELTYGVVRWQATLDWLIARKTPGRIQKPALQELLRLGLYQIFWLDRIPGHAAVNETVEMAKQDGFGPQAGFVNAVLRGYLREFDATKQVLTELKTTQPHHGWSHPEWLVTRWQKRWGAEKTAKLLEWNNTPPKTFARVNTLKADAGKLLERWRMEEKVEYDFVRRDWLDESQIFELKAHPPLADLGSFRDGWFYVQDPSTLLAVRELDPKPGETVLDFCAAPGGKTAFIAQLMRNEGRVVAQDISEDRLTLVRENCARLGVTCVEVRSRRCESADAPASSIRAFTSAATGELFDRVLVDAPCSNTGVMRRRADLRWRIQPPEIERLRATQLNLLRQAASRLNSDGVLVYSTCSLEPEENTEVVKQFLAEHRAFHCERERELLPMVEGVDGAFVARLKHWSKPVGQAARLSPSFPTSPTRE
jgi:16S rRNA (cytosine967-C5)-methyltransferase